MKVNIGVTGSFWLLFLAMVFPVTGYASYVVHSYTQTIQSVPYTDSGFYYSDGRGNSISYSETRNVPVIINRYPNGVWVYYGHDFLPGNAVIQQYINGRAAYFCRVHQGSRVMYGTLIPGEGCYTHSLHSKPSLSFQILLR